jgi:hypothetical protein
MMVCEVELCVLCGKKLVDRILKICIIILKGVFMKSLFLVGSMVVFFSCPALLYATEEYAPDISDSWLNEAIEHIQKEEYKPSLQESDYKGELFDAPKYHFANRANNLRAYFDENGMELLPRVITEENWNLKIKSIEVTCGNGDKKISGDLKVTLDGDNIRCEGDGIKIIYSNSESGIEQYVIVEEKNETEGIDFIIEMENLDISQENNGFVLSSNDDEIIYQINSIKDAEDKEISYSLSENENKLSVSINNEDVVYPINITAVVTLNNSSIENLSKSSTAKVRGLSDTPDWTAESDQDSAYFGMSVSSAGDVNGDGYSDVIVGAYYYDGGQKDEGAAFVYHGSSSGLATSANWAAESDQASTYFGRSVSGAGDVNGDGYSDVIVGAYRYDSGQSDEGKAFVYYGGIFGLSDTPDWTAESNQSGALFGYSVSGAGDVNNDGYSDVIVGVYYYNGGQAEEGAAFVYHGSSLGLATSANWTAESNQEYARFGNSVSGAGDVNGDGYSDVIVGAVDYMVEGDREGTAFVYHGGYSGLSASANWTTMVLHQDYAKCGRSVSGAGDVNGDGYSDVIVGVDQYTGGQTDEGAAFVYYGGLAGLSSTPEWTVESNLYEAHFGYSVSGAGDVNGDGYSDAIVGAYGYTNVQWREGRVYVYHGSSSGLSVSPAWTAESDQESAYFGIAVSSAGDVNGDGYSDVIVGANYYDNVETDEGMAFVYHGSSSGLSGTPGWSDEPNQDSVHFGYSVSGAGDVNGDGYSDVIVGAPNYDGGQAYEGGAFVYHGSSSGLSTNPQWWKESNQDSAYFGYSVSSAGDVNNDGYSDVIVGAYGYDNGETNEGAAFVYHGGSSGLASSPDWTNESDQSEARFGTSVSGAGDVNGDGYSDVIVGAPNYGHGETCEGMSFVYYGNTSGLSTSPVWTAESDQEYAFFGSYVSTAGDVNADGYSDVIVGSTHYDNGETDEGAAFVYHGSSSGLSTSADWSSESNQPNMWSASVSSAGDVNGDGYSDVIVGFHIYDNGETGEGVAFVYHGSSSGLSLVPDWTGDTDQEWSLFGWAVSTAGDVNGDGYSDVIVGDHLYGGGQAEEGRAYVYYGNGNGLSLIPTQSMLDGSHLVQLGNATGISGVQLNILGRTPAGRGKVKLQWEVKELGEGFNGIGVGESSNWYDTDTNGIEISEDVIGLSEATAYHWRVRLKYNPVTYNDAVHSRWLSIGPNGWNETDFITTALSGIEDYTGSEGNIQLSVFPSISTNIFSIRFHISEEEAEKDISLKVYNKAGIMVKNLFTGKKPAGTHTITWNGNNNSDKALPNDVYFISLKKGKGENPVRKIVLLR